MSAVCGPEVLNRWLHYKKLVTIIVSAIKGLVHTHPHKTCNVSRAGHLDHLFSLMGFCKRGVTALTVMWS